MKSIIRKFLSLSLAVVLAAAPLNACTKKRYKILPNRYHEFSFVIKA